MAIAKTCSADKYRRASGLTIAVIVATVALHVAVPKSGIMEGKVPLTIADLLFGVALALGLIAFAKAALPDRRLKRCAVAVVLGCAFFALRIIAFPLVFGRPLNSADVGFLVALAVYPLIFPLIAAFVPPARAPSLYRVLAISIAIVLAYGMVQKAFGPYKVVIRGVTANWTEARGGSHFLAAKDNVISSTGSLKLTSTYSNGNLLGVNLLLLLPCGIAAAKRWWLRVPLLAAGVWALLLTGSRSAWVGAMFMLVIVLIPTPRSLLPKLAAALALWFALGFFLFHTSLGRERVTRMSPANVESWGGRLEPALILWRGATQGSSIGSVLLGPYGRTRQAIRASGGGAYEIFYAALFQEGGLLGLLIWLTPIWLSFREFWPRRKDPYIRAVMLGLIAWMCAAVADGGFWLPPTAFIFWCVLALGWLRAGALNRERQPHRLEHAQLLTRAGASVG
ncbi:MAG: hypothetical protein ACRD2E_04620 [Terriglobales bacterium]